MSRGDGQASVVSNKVILIPPSPKSLFPSSFMTSMFFHYLLCYLDEMYRMFFSPFVFFFFSSCHWAIVLQEDDTICFFFPFLLNLFESSPSLSWRSHKLMQKSPNWGLCAPFAALSCFSCKQGIQWCHIDVRMFLMSEFWNNGFGQTKKKKKKIIILA